MKLYWRYKKDDRWTWKPALTTDIDKNRLYVWKETEEEE